MAEPDLKVTLKADTRELTAGLRTAAREAQAAGNAMQSSLGGASANVSGAMTKMASAAKTALLGLGTAVVAVSAVLVKLTMDALEVADGLVRMSDQTGFTIEALQKYRFAANQAGVSTEELDAGMKSFVARLGDAKNGTGDAAAAMSLLGVQLSDDSGPRTIEAVFMDIVEALERIPDPAKRAAAAADVFGKGAGGSLATLASQGAGAVRALMQEAEKLGIVMGGDLVRQGDAAGDAIDRLKTIITAGLNKAMLQAAPQIEEFINELTSDPEAIQRLINKLVEGAQAIASIGAAAARSVVVVTDFFRRLGEGIAKATLAEPINDLTDRLAELDAEMSRASAGNQTEKFAELQHQYLQTEIALRKLLDTQSGVAALMEGTPAAAGGTTPAAAVTPAAAIDYTPIDKAAQERRDKEVAAEQEKNRRIVAAAMERMKSEEQIENERHESELAALAAETDEQLTIYGGRAAAKEELERAHQSAIAKIRSEAQSASIVEATQDAADAAAKKQELADFLFSLQDANAQELIIEQEFYDAKLEQLIAYREQERLTEAEYNAELERMAAAHGAALADIDANKYLQRFTLTQFATTKEQGYAAAMMDKALATYAGQSKRGFELTKKLNLAKAIVSLPGAVMQSFAQGGGYPWGLIPAAAMTAIGLANIAAIQKSQYGSGSAPATSTTAAGGSSGGGESMGGGGGGGGSPAPQINLSIAPGIYNDQDMRRLAESLQSAYRDGAPGG